MVERRGGKLPFNLSISSQDIESAVRDALEVLGFEVRTNSISRSSIVHIPYRSAWSFETRLEMSSIRSQMAHVMFPCLSELNALFGDTSVLVRDLLRNHFHYELPELLVIQVCRER